MERESKRQENFQISVYNNPKYWDKSVAYDSSKGVVAYKKDIGEVIRKARERGKVPVLIKVFAPDTTYILDSLVA